jgi:hypothetical protein
VDSMRLELLVQRQGQAPHVRLGAGFVRHEGNPVVRAHGAHEHQPARVAPHQPFAQVASNIEVCRRVEPQQLHELVTALVEKSSRTAGSSI